MVRHRSGGNCKSRHKQRYVFQVKQLMRFAERTPYSLHLRQLNQMYAHKLAHQLHILIELHQLLSHFQYILFSTSLIFAFCFRRSLSISCIRFLSAEVALYDKIFSRRSCRVSSK